MLGINSVVSHVFNFFRSALAPLINQLKTKEGRDTATKTLISVIDLGEHAVPLVKAAVSLSPASPYAQPLIDAAAKLGLKLEDALKNPDEYQRIGQLIRIEGEGLRNVIAESLPAAEHGVEIAGEVIKTAEELNLVPGKIFDAAVHNAHVALDVAGEIVKPVSTDSVDTAPLQPQN